MADPGPDRDPSRADLLSVVLLVFFVSLVVTVAALLLVPALY